MWQRYLFSSYLTAYSVALASLLRAVWDPIEGGRKICWLSPAKARSKEFAASGMTAWLGRTVGVLVDEDKNFIVVVGKELLARGKHEIPKIS